MDLVYDSLRLLNALLASLVLCALVYRGRMYWGGYPPLMRLFYVSFVMYVFGVAYASVLSYGSHTLPGVRLFIDMVANIIAIYAFWKHRHSLVSDAELHEHNDD